MRLLFLCLLLALLGSCRQDPTTGTTTVSGQVVEQAHRQPVPNAHVQVYHASSGGGYAPVGSPYPADAQGRFSFQFDATSPLAGLPGIRQSPQKSAGRGGPALWQQSQEPANGRYFPAA